MLAMPRHAMSDLIQSLSVNNRWAKRQDPDFGGQGQPWPGPVVRVHPNERSNLFQNFFSFGSLRSKKAGFPDLH